VFEITKVFRNREEISRLHNPEFTMLEWYRVQADYRAIMDDFEELFIKIIGGEKLVYQGEEYDLKLPWPRISFEEAFAKYAGRKIEGIKDEDFYQIFYNEVEPKLRASHRPAFVYDYPVSQAALARKCPGDLRFAERWEVFLAGIELGNCFSELTDPIEQRKRFETEMAQRRAQGKAQYPIDEELLKVLGKMPECAGIAVGVDRLVMLAADAETIGETLFFPAEEMYG
jgi:lysyl-tRNA synthetase class 2